MNNLGQTPDPEYLQQECTRLLQEVKSRLRSRKFQDDLRVFLRILERDFSNFLNPQIELLTRVKLKLNGENGFIENLQNFLDRERNENVSQELEQTKSATRDNAQKVLQKKPPLKSHQTKTVEKVKPTPDPELIKKMSVLDDYLNYGYSFSGTGFYQLQKTVKESLNNKPQGGFFGKLFGKEPQPKQGKDLRILPRQIMEHLVRTQSRPKRSPMTWEHLKKSAEKYGIQWEELKSHNYQESPEPAFLLTEDGYCLAIHRDRCLIQFDPIPLDI
jgi:hypothetical protein